MKSAIKKFKSNRMGILDELHLCVQKNFHKRVYTPRYILMRESWELNGVRRLMLEFINPNNLRGERYD